MIPSLTCTGSLLVDSSKVIFHVADPNYIGSIGSIGPVILVNVYMLSVQVMKRTIKLLPLLGQHLASRAIKQLNEHITTAVLNTGRRYNT